MREEEGKKHGDASLGEVGRESYCLLLLTDWPLGDYFPCGGICYSLPE